MSRILEIIGALALIGIVVVGGVVVASGGSLVVPAFLTDTLSSSEQGSNSPEQGPASIGIEENRWGQVTDDSIGIQSEIGITNPRTRFQSNIQYSVLMNGNEIATGGTGQTDIAVGESTVTSNTRIDRGSIDDWWQSHVENDEKTQVNIQARGEFAKGPFSVDPSTTKERTMETEMMDSIQQTLSNMEGELPLGNVEITEVNARWGEVDNIRTEVIISLTVKNNRNIPIPITDFSGTTRMGDVRLLSWESQQQRNIIRRNSEKEITVRAYIDNNNIDDWLASHVKNDEVTNYQNSVTVSIAGVGDESPFVTCEGKLNTKLFVDNTRGISDKQCEFQRPDRQELQSELKDNRIEGKSEPVRERVEEAMNRRDDSSDNTEDNTKPSAEVTASPPSGEAPLTVEFDGSGSSDPDGTIESYEWEIDGPTPGGRGETITRRFQTQGEYTATLTVTDDDGLTDTADVTVTVEGRFGRIDNPPKNQYGDLAPLIKNIELILTMVLLPIPGAVLIFRRKD
ncbi:PKD domain-containing protein [Haloquadratum walsbyi]|uniref:PKD domain-containing protein n=1 Tax=Haloquadratum walsbyi TaxID=293091 RepID=UPI0015F3FB18|nr:PKD domain-containing protein [Haloquadratum walsbyi]